MSEQDWNEGNRAAYVAMLGECCRQLGYDDIEAAKASWIREREATVAALRQACKEFGNSDSNWPDNLHLADILDKHLLPLLRAKSA
jgi:hypothetical protein